jgi:hypothetical protein
VNSRMLQAKNFVFNKNSRPLQAKIVTYENSRPFQIAIRCK